MKNDPAVSVVLVGPVTLGNQELLDGLRDVKPVVLSNPLTTADYLATDAVAYTTNPPTSGPHNPEPAQDGIYDPGNTPAPEQLVHSLEHGRVQFQYAPSLPKAGRDEIEATFDEQLGSFGPGYHAQVFENTTKMPYAVAATAWTHVLGCKSFTPQTIDALRAFRARYTDKGPEFIP